VTARPEREIAIEMSDDSDYDGMPEDMVNGSARLLGSRWRSRQAQSRLVLMFNDGYDDVEYNAVWSIAREFAKRWSPGVLDDHANWRWRL
jgi:hypothetical protein